MTGEFVFDYDKLDFDNVIRREPYFCLGPDDGSILRSVRYHEQGCLVRALESVGQAAASDGEIDHRMKQIDGVRPINHISLGENNWIEVDYAAVGRAVKEEQLRVDSYIEHIRGGKTTLSVNLSRFNVRKEMLSTHDMRAAINSGIQVMTGFGVYKSRPLNLVLHATHLGLEEDKFVSISDGGLGLKLDDTSNYPCWVFDDRRNGNQI